MVKKVCKPGISNDSTFAIVGSPPSGKSQQRGASAVEGWVPRTEETLGERYPAHLAFRFESITHAITLSHTVEMLVKYSLHLSLRQLLFVGGCGGHIANMIEEQDIVVIGSAG